MEAGRAYSTIAVKALDEERREFVGTATAPAHDRVNDSIDPLGCRFKNPLILLRAHDHTMPIGTVNFDRPTKAGITFRASIPKISEPGLLKDRVDMAWGEVKHGLIRAVSVGFRPTSDPKPNAAGGLDWPKVEIFELSTVAVPAQELATIDQVKAIDAAVRRGEKPLVKPSTADQISDEEIHKKAMAFLDDHLWPVRSKNSKPVIYTQGQHDMITQGFMVLMELAVGLHHDVGALRDKLTSIERKGLESPLQYRGVWKPGTYSAGSFVTHAGSMWHADKATDFKPGEGGGWTLSVKSGRDGKDAK
jgi:hypothetical protein